jgi:hypothetical protein
MCRASVWEYVRSGSVRKSPPKAHRADGEPSRPDLTSQRPADTTSRWQMRSLAAVAHRDSQPAKEKRCPLKS